MTGHLAVRRRRRRRPYEAPKINAPPSAAKGTTSLAPVNASEPLDPPESDAPPFEPPDSDVVTPFGVVVVVVVADVDAVVTVRDTVFVAVIPGIPFPYT